MHQQRNAGHVAVCVQMRIPFDLIPPNTIMPELINKEEKHFFFFIISVRFMNTKIINIHSTNKTAEFGSIFNFVIVFIVVNLMLKK